MYYCSVAISEYIELAKQKRKDMLRKKGGKKGARNKLEYEDQVMVKVYLCCDK